MPLCLLLLLILLLLLEDAGAQQGDGCGHTVLGPESGTLTSRNYPQTYPNSTVCEWEIRVKIGERIRIKFGDFDIEGSGSCHFNYLRIYNGIGVSRTEIGKYCGLGLQMNHSIESKSNEITVLFMSGIHVSGRGFLASYSVVDKQDLITCLDTASNFWSLSSASTAQLVVCFLLLRYLEQSLMDTEIPRHCAWLVCMQE